jgi:hypothetical protein
VRAEDFEVEPETTKPIDSNNQSPINIHKNFSGATKTPTKL